MEFRRKNIRLPACSYAGQRWYFLSACTEGRTPRFLRADSVEEQLALLDQMASKEKFATQAYCFMPDHLAFSNGFKQRSGYAFKQRVKQRLWQHKPYDHILRDGDSWEAVATYIWMNPVREGLCQRAED